MENTILIVEDQAIVAMTIESHLEELGYKVAGVASTGEEAITLAREKKPDLVLMDINLEGVMDGIATAEQIGLFLDSPIIYLTAYSDEETIRRASLTGPFTYLTKPYKLRDLHSNIQMALYKKKQAPVKDLRERRLQVLLKKVEDPLIATDEHGLIIFINDPAANLLGIPPADAIEKPLERVFRIKEGTENPLFSKSYQVGPDTPGLLGFPFQCMLINQNSQEIPIITSTSMIKNRDNNYGGLFLVFRDCRPVIDARRQLKHLEASTGVMLDAITVPMVIIDTDLRIEEYNPAFGDWCRAIGIQSDLVNRNIKNISGLLTIFRPVQMNKVLATNESVIVEEQVAMGKKTLVFEVRFIPLKEKGETKHLVITISDSMVEQQLKRAGIVTVTENMRVIDNMVRHFSDILGNLIEIKSLALLEDPNVTKDWISEQIIMHAEKVEQTSSGLYEIFLRELSGKHTFRQVYDQKKKQIDREHEYVLRSGK